MLLRSSEALTLRTVGRKAEFRHNPYHDPATGRFTSGGGSGSGVDKSGKSGIMNDSGDEFYPVSPDAYDKIENLGVFGDERDEKIREAMKHVLENVKDKEPGTESLALYKAEDISRLDETTSKTANGSVKALDASIPYISIHNHASGETFSLSDYKKLYNYRYCQAIFVVGYNGNAYGLKKTSNYNSANLLSLIYRQKNGFISLSIEEFIKESEKCGLKYYKRTN